MILFIIYLLSILSCSAQVFAPVPLVTTNGTNIASAGTAWITNQSLGTPRNNYSGDVGCQFTPSVNDTITSLARWVISGNAQTHTLYLVDSTSCIVLASTTINCSGAASGQYLYGSITPVSVTSGHGYYVVSQEFNGGDQWYDDNTTITGTAFAVAGFPIYTSADPPSGNCNVTGSLGECFGPVNFLHLTPP